MGSPVELQRTVVSLRRQAEALLELQLRCARLRDARERPRGQLDAVTASIDERIDACLLIAERAAAADPDGSWSSAVTELERQLRRLAVLRSQILALYVASSDATALLTASSPRPARAGKA
jgi:hypothetical protein